VVWGKKATDDARGDPVEKNCAYPKGRKKLRRFGGTFAGGSNREGKKKRSHLSSGRKKLPSRWGREAIQMKKRGIRRKRRPQLHSGTIVSLRPGGGEEEKNKRKIVGAPPRLRGGCESLAALKRGGERFLFGGGDQTVEGKGETLTIKERGRKHDLQRGKDEGGSYAAKVRGKNTFAPPREKKKKSTAGGSVLDKWGRQERG